MKTGLLLMPFSGDFFVYVAMATRVNILVAFVINSIIEIYG